MRMRIEGRKGNCFFLAFPPFFMISFVFFIFFISIFSFSFPFHVFCNLFSFTYVSLSPSLWQGMNIYNVMYITDNRKDKSGAEQMRFRSDLNQIKSQENHSWQTDI